MGSGLHPRDGEFRGLGLEPRLAYDFFRFLQRPPLARVDLSPGRAGPRLGRRHDRVADIRQPHRQLQLRRRKIAELQLTEISN
jgi:hypothetical protein